MSMRTTPTSAPAATRTMRRARPVARRGASVRTIEYLLGPDAPMFLPGVLAGLAIALLCAPLSVLVVLKRMAFIGQGVSHAAFGGVGLAVLLGLAATQSFALIALFCVGSAWGIALASGRRALRADTVIGIFLVGAMALGALLVALRSQLVPGGATPPGWEQILFGSILEVGKADAALAWVMAGATLAALWWWRRPMLFWAFDETSAEAYGVRTGAMRFLLLTLLALAVVTAMKLAGVVLATALLVLPGATALRLSARLWPALGLSLLAALLGVMGGLVMSYELDLPPGACIVMTQVALFVGACVVGALRSNSKTEQPRTEKRA
ncbi:MAG: metal ABC transporter permease [Phycisphaerales bacterium]|nr:MAG: metal ABC transporter permease [Phycisphaerales bacterium]